MPEQDLEDSYVKTRQASDSALQRLLQSRNLDGVGNPLPAKPATPPAPAAPPAEGEPSFMKDVVGKTAMDFGKDVIGSAEAAGHLVGSGLEFLNPVPGIAGIVQTLLTKDPARGAKVISDLQSAIHPYLVYEPQTEAGLKAKEAITYAFDKLNQAAEYLGGKTQEGVSAVAGDQAGMVAGATVHSLVQLAPMLFEGVKSSVRAKLAKGKPLTVEEVGLMDKQAEKVSKQLALPAPETIYGDGFTARAPEAGLSPEALKYYEEKGLATPQEIAAYKKYRGPAEPGKFNFKEPAQTPEAAAAPATPAAPEPPITDLASKALEKSVPADEPMPIQRLAQETLYGKEPWTKDASQRLLETSNSALKTYADDLGFAVKEVKGSKLEITDTASGVKRVFAKVADAADYLRKQLPKELQNEKGSTDLFTLEKDMRARGASEDEIKLAVAMAQVEGAASDTKKRLLLIKKAATQQDQPGAEPLPPGVKAYPYIEAFNKGKLRQEVLDALSSGKEPPPLTSSAKVDSTAGKAAAAAPDAIVKGDKVLKIDWSQIGDPDKIDAVVKKLTKMNEGAIDVARRGVQSDETTKQLANALGLTVEDIVSRQRGAALNAEQTQAYIDLFGASVAKLQRLTVEAAENIASGKMAPEIEQQFRQQLGVTTAITEQIFGARAEAGRALRIWGTTAQNVKETAAAVKGETEILTAGRTLADVPIERLVQMMQSLERPEQVATFARGIARGNASVNALMEAWVNGLLSNPVTHTVNALSNATVSTMGVGERALAVGGRQLANKLGLADDVAGAVKGETTAMIQGAMGGVKDALRMAWRSLRTGESQLGFEKIDLPRRAISSEAFNASGSIGKGIDLLGESVRLPGRFMVSSDDFFKSINYRMELHAQAWREAVKDGGTSEQMAQRMAQILSDPPSKVRAAAEAYANYQTFTNALEGGDFISEAGRSALQFSNRHPLARLILPFIRTPTNIFKYTLERTPIANLALKQVRDDLLAGGIRRDLALAKTAMGGMILGTAAYLAAQGKITGAGPANYNLRKIKEQTGWQPYSVLIGDKYYAIGRIAPIGTLFGIAANYHEIAGDLSDESAAEIVMILTMAYKDVFMDQTFLSGISSVIQAIESPDRRADAYVKQLARSAVPAGLAQLARVMDPTVREAESIMDVFRSRVPGYSKDLPPDRNLWGEPILREGGIGPDMITPFYSSTRNDDPVAEEIVRLQVPVAQVPNWIGGSRPGKGVLADPKVGQGVWLNPQEYDRLRLLAAGIDLKGATMPLRERLEAEMEKPFFQRQSDDGKKVVLYSIIQQYREAARMQLLQEFPELGDLAAEIQREKAESFKPIGGIGVR